MFIVIRRIINALREWKRETRRLLQEAPIRRAGMNCGMGQGTRARQEARGKG